MNEEEVKKAICGNCKMAGMGVCGACQIDFETATQQICQLSPKTADYPDGYQKDSEEPELTEENIGGEDNGIIEEVFEPKPESDKTKLHEYGSPKNLPHGWRGRILKGNTEPKPGMSPYAFDEHFTSPEPKPEGGLEDFFAEHHCEFDAIMMAVLSKIDAIREGIQVEPKPDEGRLLSPGSIAKLASSTNDKVNLVWLSAKEQRDLTASGKDAEFAEKCAGCESWLWKMGERQEIIDKWEAQCQEKIDGIVEGIEKRLFCYPSWKTGTIERYEWQALKEKAGVK